MDWDKIPKIVKRKLTHLIFIYEEIDVLKEREQTQEIKHAIQVLKMRCKEIRNELARK